MPSISPKSVKSHSPPKLTPGNTISPPPAKGQSSQNPACQTPDDLESDLPDWRRKRPQALQPERSSATHQERASSSSFKTRGSFTSKSPPTIGSLSGGHAGIWQASQPKEHHPRRLSCGRAGKWPPNDEAVRAGRYAEDLRRIARQFASNDLDEANESEAKRDEDKK